MRRNDKGPKTKKAKNMKITIIPTLSDNYSYLLEAGDGTTAIIDPGEPDPVIEELKKQKKKLNYIIATHHHHDHIGGNAKLQQKYGAKIAGPEKDAARIPGIEITLSEGETFDLGDEPIEIYETPGHTSGHISLYAPRSKALFCADTLFSMGCGRLFEGSPGQMFESLQKLSGLPDDTQIYPGHEYTQSNGEFCLSIEPDNPALQHRMEQVREARAAGQPTIPVTLETEKATNVFLRAQNAEDFARLRAAKDEF